MMGLDVVLRGPDLQGVAAVDTYSRIEAVVNYADVSRGTLDLTETSASTDYLRIIHEALAGDTLWKYGLIVKRGTEVIMSGPFTGMERTSSEGHNARRFSFASDSVWLERRMAYPSASPYTASAYDASGGLGEAVMKHYVSNNLGPGAAPERQLQGLTIQANQGYGVYVSIKARWRPVIEYIRSIATVGGDLGFEIVQVDDHLEFQVYTTTDRTEETVLSVDYDSLQGFNYATDSPEANYVFAAGGGEGTARVIREGFDGDSITQFGRIEGFVDQRHTSDTDELDQAVLESLAERASRSSLKIDPFSSTDMFFRPGDIVTAQVDGVRIVDVIRQIKYSSAGDSPLLFEPVIGPPGTAAPEVPSFFRKQKANEIRLNKQETR